MAKEKEMTPEEKERKERISNAKTSLENIVYQTVMGANHLKSNPFLYGQLGMGAGENAYNSFYENDKIKEMKDAEFNQKLAEGKALGIAGEPMYPTNYDISIRIAKQVEEHKMTIPLRDLGDVIKKISPELKFSVPEQLAGITPLNLMTKLSQKKQLNDAEKDAFAVYKGLSEAYNRGVALKVGREGYYADLNEQLNEISEKYAPKKTEE